MKTKLLKKFVWNTTSQVSNPVIVTNKHGLRPQCALFRKLAAIIDYFNMQTTCHCLLSTIYLSLPVTAGKSKHHPGEVYIHSSQVEVHLGACAYGFRFRHKHMYAHTHTHTHAAKILFHSSSSVIPLLNNSFQR